MPKKICFLLKHCYHQIIKNRFRFVLTIIGISAATLILTSGYIGIDTYYYQNYAKYEAYNKKEALLIDGAINELIFRKIVDKAGYNYASYSDKNSFPLKVTNEKNISLTIQGNFLGTNDSFMNHLLPTGESSEHLYNSSLVKGKCFTKSDIENRSMVAIIDLALERIIFGNQNSLGKKLYIPIYKNITEDGVRSIIFDRYESLEIIGVITPSNYTKELEAKFYKNALTKKENLIYYSNIYIPYTINIDKNIENNNNTDIKINKLVFTGIKNRKALLNTLSILLKNYESNNNRIGIYTYESISKDIEYNLDNIKKSLQLIVLVILFISSINIMNTLFFAVKERINEIGIRKAVGATNEDITIQFIIEGLLSGLIGTIIGVFCSIIITSLVVIYLQSIGHFGLKLIIHPQSIQVSFILVTIISILSSSIPAFYASHIRITEALRFDWCFKYFQYIKRYLEVILWN